MSVWRETSKYTLGAFAGFAAGSLLVYLGPPIAAGFAALPAAFIAASFVLAIPMVALVIGWNWLRRRRAS